MDAIQCYFEAFNAGDDAGMLACLTDDVAHHVNEGQVRVGRDAFAAFCAHMTRGYAEKLADIVIPSDPTGTRAVTENVVYGTYLNTDAGLPQAHNQTYRLPAGSFFDTKGERISRVTTYYNLADWAQQVSP